MFWLSRWKRKTTAPEQPDAYEPVAGLLSDTGCQRQLNEDSARIVRAGICRHGDRGWLLVVADGMGGHEAGEVASQAAVELIENEYRDARGTPGEALAHAFRLANSQILRLSLSHAAMEGMGTTCTALALVGRQAWAAHVGDSRLYIVRGAGIYQLSEDHTQIGELVRKGMLTAAEGRRHDDRNVLVRALGTREELALMTWPEPMTVRPGDAFVLCSDGLYDLVTDVEIQDAVRAYEPQPSCARLVRMARDRGGYDNITVAVAAIPPSSGKRPALKVTRELEARI